MMYRDFIVFLCKEISLLVSEKTVIFSSMLCRQILKCTYYILTYVLLLLLLIYHTRYYCNITIDLLYINYAVLT